MLVCQLNQIGYELFSNMRSQASVSFCFIRCHRSQKIKSFTGGDEVTGKPLYGSWVKFGPLGNIVLTTNNRPEISGSNHSIWRLIRGVLFNSWFKEAEQDRELKAVLCQAMPGILKSDF